MMDRSGADRRNEDNRRTDTDRRIAEMDVATDSREDERRDSDNRRLDMDRRLIGTFLLDV